MYTFKELMALPLEDGEDEYLKYRAIKRRRGVFGGEGIGGPIGESAEDVSEISTQTLSNYMTKSTADAGKRGTSGRQQDKRIGGQKMADDKMRKAQGKKSPVKVAANEESASDVDEALSFQARMKKSRTMKKYSARLKLGKKRAMNKTANNSRIQTRSNKQARLMFFKKLSKGKSPSELTPMKRAEIEKRLDKLKPRIQKMAIRLKPKVRQKEKERKRSQSSK